MLLEHPYSEFISLVDKPARYLGGEYQSVRKDFDSVDVRVVLAFPDVYEIGMSHLGTKILYSLLNRSPRILCERTFTPWVDMERQLRQRSLPLMSLESARPLRDFDVIGMSLQYELTYTNCLTLLDLSGIPLRSVDREEHHPLILGGGPVATHPEPVAPFFDCILIGEAEQMLPDVLLDWTRMKRAGLPRRERLIRLAQRGYLYVPSLYSLRIDDETGRQVVDKPLDPRVPERVCRVYVPNLNEFPFPSDTPVPYAEAIFDRASIEIARGCTEGCRFCQAGMIYRPVRERDPESIVESVVQSIKKGGYDETSLTSLSTADFSCILPLMKKVMGRLREERVSLSVSSLRAYGLSPEILDEMSSVRATGLTFAPEAGTQRMRDVINKNITEEDISRSAENVFSRGWSRMKLYFMIGLPTETDEDVVGIIDTAVRLRRLGRRIRRDAEVTVSVSNHVPKPHTPFQWCSQDSLAELQRKQYLLRELARRERIEFKYHDKQMSWLEGLFSRGDRRLADVIELAHRNGARFDSWDEQFDIEIWQKAIAEVGIDPEPYLMTLPLTARLPWDHIDIGLEENFLRSEYKKALKDRLSPPCGKPYGSLLHHANLEDALADGRKLVCFDCGVACDLTQMREDRLVALRKLGADKRGEAPRSNEDMAKEQSERGQPRKKAAFAQTEGQRYRLRYRKLGRAAYIGHLDAMRLIQRMLRRAGCEPIYTRGFHPKPDMVLGPALGLGVVSLGELMDLRLEHLPDSGEYISAEELQRRLREAAPEGFIVEEVTQLQPDDKPVSRLIAAADFAIGVPNSPNFNDDSVSEVAAGLALVPSWPSRPLSVERPGKDGAAGKQVDVQQFLLSAEHLDEATSASVRGELGWPADYEVVRARVRIDNQGGVRPIELAQALLGSVPSGTRYARLGLVLSPPQS
jgi:radical SAM family uncharacterized protein/radical SAM-linked protein